MKKFLIKAIKKLETGLNFNLITKIIKSALNKKIKNFGTVKEFSFDDALKQIIVEIELKGDDKPLKIVISKWVDLLMVEPMGCYEIFWMDGVFLPHLQHGQGVLISLNP